jgi:hypothetical protein
MTLLVGRRTFGVAVRLGKLEPEPTGPFWHSISDPRAATEEPPRPSSTDPGSQAGTNDAGLARRPPFTRVPSASTLVCGSHHTRQSHSCRRVAFQDNEVLERQFHAAGAGRWSRSPPNHPTNATVGAKLPVLAHEADWRTAGGRCVAGICHHPIPLHTHGFADSQPRRDFTGRARRSSTGPPRLLAMTSLDRARGRRFVLRRSPS